MVYCITLYVWVCVYHSFHYRSSTSWLSVWVLITSGRTARNSTLHPVRMSLSVDYRSPARALECSRDRFPSPSSDSVFKGLNDSSQILGEHIEGPEPCLRTLKPHVETSKLTSDERMVRRIKQTLCVLMFPCFGLLYVSCS